MAQVHGRREVSSAILQEEGVHSLLASHTRIVAHCHCSRNGAAVQNVIAIDDRVPIYTSAVLVKAGSISIVAAANGDAIGGGQLPVIEVIFGLYVEPETANVIRAAVLDEDRGRPEPAHVEVAIHAQGPISQVI